MASLFGRLRGWRGAQHDRGFVIVPELGLAYGRVPKAANSSVKRALAAALGTGAHVRGEGPGKDGYWDGLAPRGIARVRADEARALARGLVVFTVVRNPFSRLVSAYHDKLVRAREVAPGFAKLGLGRKTPFGDFVAAIAAQPDAARDIHVRTQAGLLSDAQGLVPGRILHVENLGDDWAALQAEMAARGMSLPALGHANHRPREAADGAYYDAATVQRVRDAWGADFAAFYPDAPDP